MPKCVNGLGDCVYHVGKALAAAKGMQGRGVSSCVKNRRIRERLASVLQCLGTARDELEACLSMYTSKGEKNE